MVGGRQTISVGGPGVLCRHGNIVHEIAHCAGFFHEHSRPDRDNYIRVNWFKIKPGWFHNHFRATFEAKSLIQNLAFWRTLTKKLTKCSLKQTRQSGSQFTETNLTLSRNFDRHPTKC